MTLYSFCIILLTIGISLVYTNAQISAGSIPCICANNCTDWLINVNSTQLSLDDPRLRPTIANGHFGTIVYNSDMHINGFYHGHLSNISTRVKVPNHIVFWIDETSIQGQRNYTLNLQQGTFMELIYNTKSGVDVTTVMYASMADKHYLVTEVTLESKAALNEDVVVQIKNWMSTNTSGMNVTASGQQNGGPFIFQAEPAIPETDNVTSPTLILYSTGLPSTSSLTLPKGQSSKKYVFYSVITINVNNTDTLAKNLFEQGKDLSKVGNDGMTGFMQAHIAAWNKIWQSRIDVEGNCDIAMKVHSTYYYILSSMPIAQNYGNDSWPFFGISPGSLANDDSHNYNGHVFWDQDVWMLIGLVSLYPDIVKRTLLDSRVRHLEPAKLNAKRFGWDGAMFPWELAYSGYECDPWPPSALYEIHVTGDTALSAWTYLRLTGDHDFAQKFYAASLEIAKYYYSLLHPVPNTTDQIGIYNVMGPDEYHFPINNSVYMNSIAKIALLLPSYIYDNYNVSGDKPNANWTDAAKNIYILFDSTMNYHPQYEGYKYGELIKQADAILLGYPLMVEMDQQVRKNDLMIYQASTDALQGPAMTWAMHSVGWLEMGDEAFAWTEFIRNFDYMRAPFNLWTETATGVGTVNFVTGMGGFMQNLINGYLGIRVYDNRLEFTPYLINTTSKYTVYGLSYRNMLFNFAVDNSTVNISLTNSVSTNCTLTLIESDGKQMKINQTGVVFTGPIKMKRMITCGPESINIKPTKSTQTKASSMHKFYTMMFLLSLFSVLLY